MSQKKRYVRAKINRKEEVFEFDIEQVDDKSLVAKALDVPPSKVLIVSHSTSAQTWFKNAPSSRKHDVDLVVRR